METAALRAMTAEAAQRLKGRVWRNGLGFDAQGWEYSFSETSLDWCALRRPTAISPKKFGRGGTPEAARANAKREA